MVSQHNPQRVYTTGLSNSYYTEMEEETSEDSTYNSTTDI